MYGRQVSPWDYQTQLEQRLAQMRGQGQPQGNRYAGGSSTTTGGPQPQGGGMGGLINTGLTGYAAADKFGLLGESKDQYINSVMDDINGSFMTPEMSAYESTLSNQMAYNTGQIAPQSSYMPGAVQSAELGPMAASPVAAPIPVTSAPLAPLAAESAVATGAPIDLTAGLLASEAAVAPVAPLAEAAIAGVPEYATFGEFGSALSSSLGLGEGAGLMSALGPLGLGIGGAFALGSLLDWW